MGLAEDLAEMRQKMGKSAPANKPISQTPPSSPPAEPSPNPLESDLAEMRQKMGYGTEYRPDARTVSSAEDFAQHQALSDTPDISERFPIGATAFGIGAGIALTPFGIPVAMAGASMASGLGEGIQNGVELAFDLPTKPKDAGELLGRMGNEMMLGTLAEGAGRAIPGLARFTKILGFTPRTVSPEAREAMQFIQQEGMDTHILPAKATESYGIDLMHNIAEHSFTGGGSMSRFAANDAKAFSELADVMVERLHKANITPEQTAEILVKSADKNLRQTRQPATFIYNSITEQIKPKTVYTQVPVSVPMKGANGEPIINQFGQPVMNTVMQEEKSLKGGVKVGFKDVKRWASEKGDVQARLANIGDEVTGGTTLQRVDRLADSPYISDLIEFRTMLMGKIEGLKNNISTRKDPQIGALKHLEGLVNDRIELGLKAYNPVTHQLWKNANAIWREGNLTYNNKIIRNLGAMLDMKQKGVPEKIVGEVFKPGALTRMQIIKKAVRPDDWQLIARKGMEGLLEKSTKDGVIDGAKFMDALIGKRGLGERGLVEAVGPIEAQRWIGFANAAKVQQAKQAAGEGSMFIQLKQPGVVINLVDALGTSVLGMGYYSDSDIITGTGVVILGAPYLASKIMTNPTAAKALIEGMSSQTYKNTSRNMGIITRLMGALFPREVESQAPRKASQPLQTLNATQLALSGTHPQGRVGPQPPSIGSAYTQKTPGPPPSLDPELRQMRKVFQETR